MNNFLKKQEKQVKPKVIKIRIKINEIESKRTI